MTLLLPDQFVEQSTTRNTRQTIRPLEARSKDKKNWRIVQLPNGFYQTEYQDQNKKDTWNDVTRRETLEAAETSH